MKKILIAALVVFTSCIYADYTTPNTSVSWNLNDLVTNSAGAVTFSGGTYFVNSNLTIASSDTLKLLSNATVKLTQNVAFLVNGTLKINPPDSVKFTSADTTQRFMELRLDAASNTSMFNKFIYEYSHNGLRLLDVSPAFTNCTFRFNCGSTTTATTPALNLFNSSPVISNCLFYRNNRGAIAGGSNIANAPQILNSQFIENNVLNGNVPQINLGASGSGTTIIRGNTIRGLYTNCGGIASLPSNPLNLIIENNIIKKNRYGIALNGATTAIIRNNVIDSNNIQGIPNLGGSGINIVGAGVNAKVSKNTIRWNLWGVTLQSNAAPVFGDLSNPDTNYQGMNHIYNNSNSGIIYDLYNNTPNLIKAENNFWGTMIADSVEAHIFHQPDSSAFGLVDYLPLWSPVGISQSGSEVPNTFLLQNAYPNPFNPSTTIRFSIPQNGSSQVSASLKVYDISGRLVSVLLNSRLTAGNYEVSFDASGLASGLYFYTLSAENFSETKKMILIK
ncbi:MAG: T9SS type A sorting domain-containing protein [Ignavibacteria bacterium]|nr:T9SS type A sorting domain-containing protein [Ignavibacteria bacterium]